MDSIARIGDPAPEFELKDLAGKKRSLLASRGSIVVLNFWSAECPHSTRGDVVIDELREEWDADVVLWCIASNENESDHLLRRAAGERKVNLLLRDHHHQIADVYGAVTTPHVFVIDGEGVLRYAGGLDDTNFARRAPTRHYLKQAVEAVKAGRNPDPSEAPPYGCAIVRHMI